MTIIESSIAHPDHTIPDEIANSLRKLREFDLSARAQQDAIAELADLGYTDVWSAESGGSDAFTPLALASVWAGLKQLHLGPGGQP